MFECHIYEILSRQNAHCESEHNLFKYYPLAVSVRNRLSKIYTGDSRAELLRSFSHIQR